ADRRFAVVQLDGEEHDVGRTDRRRVVGRLDARQMNVALRALDAKAGRAQRLEMRAAREKTDVGAGGGEASAEVAADAAGTDDGDFHRRIVAKHERHENPKHTTGGNRGS